jgi:predicted membrane protein
MVMDKQDRRQALTVILTAYGTAQGVLIVLKITGTIYLHWIAVLVPSIIIAGFFLAVLIAGTIIGIRDYSRERAEEERRRMEARMDVIKKSLDEFIRSLEDDEEEESDG